MKTGSEADFQTSLLTSKNMDICMEESLTSIFLDLTVDEEGGDDPIGKKKKLYSTQFLKESPLGDSLFKPYGSISSNGKISLEVSKQPEKQYRYYNEGSKWAIKGRELNSFPTVQLRGYDPKKLAVLQVFVGRNTSTFKPHLYYQACKVPSKSSTPCREVKKDNTDVILIDMDPDKDCIVVCDFVGILRDSNIKGKELVNLKKKATKCRLVYRVGIELDDGSYEVLQIATDTLSCSDAASGWAGWALAYPEFGNSVNPITTRGADYAQHITASPSGFENPAASLTGTQLPEAPEIHKMSMATCSNEGGEELWIIGKNFLKNTEVIFEDGRCYVKKFLMKTFLIVTVPPYKDSNCNEAIEISLFVKCGSKASKPRALTLKPKQPIGRPIHDCNFCQETPISKVRKQPDINADEAMFDTVDSSFTSLDRGVITFSFSISETEICRNFL